jgi:hypothetical protein
MSSSARHRLKEAEDADGAMAAYKRAMALDRVRRDRRRAGRPLHAAESRRRRIPQQSKPQDFARQQGRAPRAGTVYGSLGTADDSRGNRQAQRENLGRHRAPEKPSGRQGAHPTT